MSFDEIGGGRFEAVLCFLRSWLGFSWERLLCVVLKLAQLPPAEKGIESVSCMEFHYKPTEVDARLEQKQYTELVVLNL